MGFYPAYRYKGGHWDNIRSACGMDYPAGTYEYHRWRIQPAYQGGINQGIFEFLLDSLESQASNGDILTIAYEAITDDGTPEAIAGWQYVMDDVSGTSEDGSVNLLIMSGGVLVTSAEINAAGRTLTGTDTNNSAITDVLTVRHVAASASAGIGTGISLHVSDAGGTEEQASIDAVMTDVTNDAESCDIVFSQNTGGTIRETLRLVSDIGSPTADRLRVTGHTEVTNGPVDVLELLLDTTGTPASGLAAGISIQVEDAGGIEEQASVDFELTNAFDGVEDCDVIFNQNTAGTVMETLRLVADLGVASADKFRYTSNTAESNGIVDVMQIRLDSTVAPVLNNLGMGISFQLDNDANQMEERASFHFQLTDVSDGAEDCDVIFNQSIAGASVARLTLDADGPIILLGPLTISIDDANNATVTDILTLTHTTSGAPGAGIGTGLSFEIEDGTLAAEQHGSIDVVTTDVTDTTEDSDMLFSIMVNGTVGTKFNLNADGLSLFEGGLEVQNDAAFGTAAFVVDNNDTDQVAILVEAANIDADVIDIDADALISTDVIDISMDSDTQTSARFMFADQTIGDIDANFTGSLMFLNSSRTKANAGLGANSDDYNVLNLTRTNAQTGGVYTASSGALLSLTYATSGTIGTNDVNGIELVMAAGSTGNSINVDHNGAASGIVIISGSDAATATLDITNEAGGFGIDVSRNLAAANTDSALVYINDDGASSEYALHIHTDAVDEATARALFIDADLVTTTQAVELTADALTSGIGVNLTSSSTNLTTNGRVLRVNASADFDDTGGYIAEISGVFTTGRGLNIVNNVIVDGFLTHINSSSTVLNATGRLFMIDHTGASTAAQGAIAEIASAATDDTTIFKVTASAALAAGIAQDISVAALTTGTALDIGDLDAINTGVGLNIASGSEAIAAGELATIALTSSGSTITAKTGALVSIASSRTELAAAATADNYDVLSVIRTNITDTAGTLTADGSVARLENVATQTAGTLTDNVDVLEIVQDAQSTGQSMVIDHNGAGNAVEIASGSDAATSTLGITNESGGFGINVSRNLAAVNTDSALVYINDDDTSDQYALHIHTDAVSDAGGGALYVDAGEMTTLNPIELTANSLTSGIGALLSSSCINLTTNGRLLRVAHLTDFDDAGGYIAEISGVFTTGRGLNVVNNAIVDGFLTHINSSSTVLDATGRLLLVDHTGASTAAQGAIAEIASAAADNTTILKVTASAQLIGGFAQEISVAALTTGTALSIGNLGAIITGRGINVASQNNTLTSGVLVRIVAASTAMTTGGHLLEVAHSADFDDTGGHVAEFSGAFTTGRLVNIVNDSVTDGFLTHINSSSTLLDATGRMLLVSHTGNATAAQGAIAEIASAAADNTTIFKVTASAALAAGIAQDISVAALTTGTALDIGDLDAIDTGIGLNIASGSEAIAAGELATIALTSSGSTITAKTGALVSIASSRTELAAAATADNYDVLSVIRTNITDTAGTLTADGSVARLENVATQTAGTLTDNVDVLEIVQDAQSTGQSIVIDHNGAGNAVEIASGSDAATSTLGITNESGGFGIDVSRNLAAANTDSALVYINDDGASNQIALHIHTDAVSDAGGQALFVDADLMTTRNPIELTADALTSGIGVNLTSTSTNLTTNGRLLRVIHSADFDDAGGYVAEISGVFTTGRGLNIVNNAIVDGFLTHINSSSTVLDATGRLFLINHTGATTAAQGAIAEIASAATDDTTIFKVTASAALAAGIAQDISVAALTTGTALDIGDLAAIISGKGINVASQNNTLTSGILVDIAAASTGLTANGRLLKVAHSADFDDTGGYVAEFSGAFTTGRLVNIVNDSVTDGFLTHINSSSTLLDATGRILLVNHTGNATAAVGAIAEIASAAADNTTIFKVTASAALAAGIALDISAASMTSGTALDISDLAAIVDGKALHIDATGTTHTTGILAHIDSAGTAITGAGRLLLVDHTAATTTTGTLSEFKTIANDETILTQFTADVLTTGNVVALTADALSSGIGVNLTSSSTAITGAGRILMVDHTGNASATGTVAEFKTVGADETLLLQLTADAILTGTALAITTDAATQTTTKAINVDTTIADIDANKAGSHVTINANRTKASVGSGANTDDYDVVVIGRASAQSGGVFTAASGSVLNLINGVAGTVGTDDAYLLEATNAVPGQATFKDVIKIAAETSHGSHAANGFGLGITFHLENGTGTTEEHASMDIVTTDVTNGAEDTDIVFRQMKNGAVAEGLRIDADGSIHLDGRPLPMSDPFKYSEYMNPFMRFPDYDATNEWAFTDLNGATGSAALSDDVRHGYLILDNGAVTDNHGVQVQYTQANGAGEIVALTASKRTYFEARVQLNAATEIDVFIGLAITDAALGDGNGVMVNPANVTDFIGFRKDDGDTDWDLTSGTAASASNTTGIATADTSEVTLSFVCDGTTNIQAYVDGVSAGAAITTNIPTTEMCVSFAVINGDGTTQQNIHVLYVRVMQEY